MNAPVSTTDTILIVDDTPENISILMGILEPMGYHLSFATSGRQALDLCRRFIPNLILMDVMMPDMDGFETCRLLKQKETTRHIPVIFVTALGDEDHLAKGFAAGGVDYIAKPVRKSELIARVKTQLNYRALIQFQRDLIGALEGKITRADEKLAAAGLALTPEPANALPSDSCVQMRNTLNRLLDLARLDMGKLPVQFKEFCVHTMMRNLASRFADFHDGSCLQIHEPPQDVVMCNDSSRLETVVSVFIENALSHGGGGITEVNVHHDDEWIWFDIKDNGCGFAFQADELPLETVVRKLNDQGVGLKLADKLAPLLGLDITLSTLENGSRIRVKTRLQPSLYFTARPSG